MIRKAIPEDYPFIYENYRRSNPSVSNESRQTYFDLVYDMDNTYVQEVNGHVVASLQVNPVNMMLNGKLIRASYFCNRFSFGSRNDKYGEELLNAVVGYQDYQSLISLIGCETENEYHRYHFESRYRQRVYAITRNDLAGVSYDGVSKEFSLALLKDLYSAFMQSFNGYLVHDRAYYARLTDLLQARRTNLAVYYDETGAAKGYMIYETDDEKLTVLELVYLDGAALMHLLAYGLRFKPLMLVYVSEYENFKKAFPKVRFKTVIQASVRINDSALFDKLFDRKTAPQRDDYAWLDTPIALHEPWL